MKKKRTAWLGLLGFLPLLALLIFVNVYVDPANLFHNISKSLGDSIMEGTPTYIATGNLDERIFRQRMIEKMDESVECVAIGPSIMMGVGREHVGTDSFYNLGISGADYYDIMAQFGLMEINGVKPKRILFCVDTYYFCDSVSNASMRNVALKPYAYYMNDILNGAEPEIPKADTKAENQQRLLQLFSISYFQSGIEYLKSSGQTQIERWGVWEDGYTGSYYLSDGSLVYSEEARNRNVEAVVADAESYPIDYHFAVNEHISTQSTTTFEKLIGYLQQQGTQIDLYLLPMAPALWDMCDTETHPIIGEVESFAGEMAEKYGLHIYGSFNPYNVGIPNEDFLDSRHMKRESISKYFEF